MRYSVPLAGLFAAVAFGSDVHQLNKDTFKPFVEEHDLVLAECMSHLHPSYLIIPQLQS